MLSIIGCGKMGRALAEGILTEQARDDLTIVERSSENRDELNEWIKENRYQRVTVTDVAVPCEGSIIAVKLKDVELAVGDAVNAGAKRILSVAAGVSLAKLHEWAGGRTPVIRAMPNIGAMVHKSATAIASGTMAHPGDVNWAEEVLKTCGSVVRVSEEQMDAVTGLSGSGPAYIFLVAEALIDAGVHAGLRYEEAKMLAISTIEGASALLKEREESPGELRSMVTTPAGTTASGLRVLEHNNIRAAFSDAVLAAATRSKEMSALADARK